MWSLLMLALCSSLQQDMIPSNCDSLCSDNEYFVAQVNPCNTCDSRGQCTVLEEQKPGCDCRMGHYRNREGVCVPEEECQGEPPIIENSSLQQRSRPILGTNCGKDEEFLECGCLKTCCNGGRNDNCAAQCLKGCFCREGLVRNDYGKCVKLEDCGRGGNGEICGINEEFKDCGTACPLTCSNRNEVQICTDQCVSGCFCKDGLVRNEQGMCVDPNQCPNEACGEREVYNACGSACPPTCSNRGRNQICTQQCVPGCFCEEGLVRNDQGVCIEPEDCPGDSCPENEEYSTCANPCNRCQKIKRCEFVCKPGCNCKKGYSRDLSGRCVPKMQCPSIDPTPPLNTCGKDEQFYDCIPSCHGTCFALTRKTNIFCQQACRKGCYCKEGLYKRKDGKCVPPSKCNPQGPTPKPSNPICLQEKDAGPCLALFRRYFYKKETGECEEFTYGGCRGNSNNFVTKEDCEAACGSSTQICPENEVPTDCVVPCNDCQTRGKCNFLVCKKGCDCKKGYFRDFGGRCIPELQCPLIDPTPPPETCDEDEEYYECIPSCSNTCKAYTRNPPIFCNQICIRGCFCKEGLYQNDEGTCVPPEQCPNAPTPTTLPSEPICEQKKEVGPCKAAIPRYYYNKKTKKCEKFTYGGCKGNSNNFQTLEDCKATCGKKPPLDSICTQKKDVGPCKAAMPRYYYNKKTKKCEKFIYGGCKGNSNNFQTLEDCEAACGRGKCPKNEVPTDCVIPCNDCQTRGKCNFLLCNKGCDCNKGYFRDFRGRCIPELQCPLIDPTPPPTEICDKDQQFYECIPSCSRTCKAHAREPKIYCNQLCISGCFCKEGLYQNDEGTCVPPEQCLNAPTTLPSETQPTCGKDEEYYRCMPTCRNTCENYGAVRPICSRLCRPGCFCKKGMVKRKDGKCVESSQCKSTLPTKSPQQCGPNEAYYKCRPTCKNTCDNYQAEHPICPRICIEGCFCKKGLVQRSDGKCVKPSKCKSSTPAPTKPPSDSICTQKKDVGPCKAAIPRYYYNKKTKMCEKFIYGGCKGNSNNFQTLEDCEAACGRKPPSVSICEQNKEVGPCKAGFKRYYYNKKTKTCEQFTYGGCKGNKNNFRTLEDCEAACERGKCPKNEVPTDCVIPCNDCQTRGKCNFLVCNKGCDCNKGYFRDFRGRCIPELQCPLIDPTPPPENCDEDEQYYECIPSCSRTCKAYTRVPKILCKQRCVKGCFCKEGFYQNDEGACVPPEQCPSAPTTLPSESPQQCGPDEQYYPTCAPKCTGTCEAYNNPGIYNCPLCEPGCWCKEGLVKRSDGQCVSPSQCSVPPTVSPSPTCGPDEEFYNCVPNCRNTCATYNQKHRACPLYCRSGCFCKQGMVKNDDGQCVLISQCESPPSSESPQHCGPDEQYYPTCAPKCTGTCEAYNNPGIYHCPLCKSGCWCKEGLVKRSDGQCVSPSQCSVPPTEGTQICPENEVPTDCVVPCNDCQTRGKCNFLVCNKGCDCEKGYFRDFGGRCIPELQCPLIDPTPPPETCDEDEEYYECIPSCSNTCKAHTRNPPIFCNQICIRGCFCKKGLYQNDEGTCVPPEQCPNAPTPTTLPSEPSTETCDEDEEYYQCKPNCRNTCSTYNRTEIACPDICQPGCFCKKGLVEDDDGECVSPNECESSSTEDDCVSDTPDQCGKDEKYYDCSPSCGGTCDTYRLRPIINCRQCVPGCWCYEGYVKRRDGKCVLEADCPADETTRDSCRSNEVYKQCGSACPPTCSNRGENQICTLQCVPGCFCKDGLVRDDQGECIEPEDCPQSTQETQGSTEICDENEEYTDCGSACPPTCSNQGKKQACILLCVPGCFCREGLVRNDVGKCVEPEDCPSSPEEICKENEEYLSCGSACPPTCSNSGKNEICTTQCVSGCFCEEGFVRNDQGECVKPEECPENGNEPSKKCGKDEVYYDECAPSCTGTCDTYNRKNMHCPRCRPGCWCKKGFVKNKEGKCIPSFKCPSGTKMPHSCPENQQYYECIPSCKRTCMTYNSSSAYCAKEACLKGCFCNEGFVMNKDGECVRPEKCPTRCPFNQKYWECMPSCENQCNPPDACTAVCQPGCFCRDGLVLREDGKCVRKELCNLPEACQSLDEQYYECKPDCYNRCKPPEVCVAACFPGCFCRQGLVLSEEGTCIPKEQCPQSGNNTVSRECEGPDQEYYECFSRCQNSCATRNNFCPAFCESGCFCKRGLFLDDDGNCVEPKKCEDTGLTPRNEDMDSNEDSTGSKKCSGVNEVIVPCAKPKFCNTCGIRGNCKLKRCERGCDCKSGYYRDGSGTCIPESQCPGSQRGSTENKDTSTSNSDENLEESISSESEFSSISSNYESRSSMEASASESGIVNSSSNSERHSSARSSNSEDGSFFESTSSETGYSSASSGYEREASMRSSASESGSSYWSSDSDENSSSSENVSSSFRSSSQESSASDSGSGASSFRRSSSSRMSSSFGSDEPWSFEQEEWSSSLGGGKEELFSETGEEFEEN